MRLSSIDAIGKTFKDGNPGYGICDPGNNSGLNVTLDDIGISSIIVTDENELAISGRPNFLSGAGTISVHVKS